MRRREDGIARGPASPIARRISCFGPKLCSKVVVDFDRLPEEPVASTIYRARLLGGWNAGRTHRWAACGRDDNHLPPDLHGDDALHGRLLVGGACDYHYGYG